MKWNTHGGNIEQILSLNHGGDVCGLIKSST